MGPGPHEGRRHCGEGWGQSRCLSWPQVQGGALLQTPRVRAPLPALPHSLAGAGAAAAGLPSGLAPQSWCRTQGSGRQRCWERAPSRS